MSAVDILRDALFGNPPSPTQEPSREGVLAAFTELSASLVGTALGIENYATVAALQAAVSPQPGQQARVYNDPTAANNVLYVYRNGAWVVDVDFLNTLTPLVQAATGDKNLFDPSAVATGFEVQTDGQIANEANSVLSGAIYVGNLQAVSISGLADNPAISRVYAFYSALPAGTATFISSGQISGNSASGIPVPAGAQYACFCVKQRQTGSLNMATVQFEGGLEATAYQPYTARIATIAGKRVGDRPQPAFVRQVDYSGDRNLFNAAAVLVTTEVQYSGALAYEANSVVSAPIYVGHADAITFSGLAPNPDFSYRVVAFYSGLPTDASTFIAYRQLTANTISFTVPTGAQFMRFSPKQRQSGAVSLATVQVEKGWAASAYQAYTPRLVGINASRVANNFDQSAGIVALFGDSITETENVAAGQYVYGSKYRANWPDQVLPSLNYRAAYSFAKESAGFATRADTSSNYQRFQYQLDIALAQGFVADTVIIALGINDFRFLPGSLGSYDTAMSKSIAALDVSVPIESARRGFYRLQDAWPRAVKFVSLPLQNGQGDMAALKTWNDLIARMAMRYGFQVIDCYSQSGIVADFETASSQGDDLADGLHPSTTGQIKQGRLIGAAVRNRLFV